MRPEHYDLDLALDLDGGRLEGRVRLTLRNDSGSPVQEISFLLNRKLRVSEGPSRVTQGVVPVAGFEAMLVNHVRVALPDALHAGNAREVDLLVEGPIGDHVETGMLYVRDRIDPEYTILRPDAFAYPRPGTPDWSALKAAGLPPFSWRARIAVPATHRVVCGGELVERVVRDGRARHEFRSIRPSGRMDFAIARYETIERGRLRVHHFPGDAEGAARVLGCLERAFRMYEAWFGPLREATPFVVIEIPDGWGSQADVTCILQTAAAFRDPARLVEVYHEVSHLWNVPPTDHPSPRWNEGLAMFLQFRTADEIDGTSRLPDALNRAAATLRERFAREPRNRDVPMARYGSESLTHLSYHVGMLMFGDLFDRVGAEKFDRIIGGFYREYADRGASTAEFIRFANEQAGGTLEPLFHEWIHSTDWISRRPGDGTSSRT